MGRDSLEKMSPNYLVALNERHNLNNKEIPAEIETRRIVKTRKLRL